MESVGVLNAIEVLQVARRRRKEEYRKIEDEQVAEHEKLMAKIRILKEEKKNTKENIGKNLRSLTLHEHSIRKLLYAGEDTAGLPISTECHRQTGALLSEGIQFMNAVQNIYEDLSDSTKDKNINSADLLSDIKSCAESIGSELYRAKSAIVQAETIRVNTDALQEHYHVTNDEHADI